MVNPNVVDIRKYLTDAYNDEELTTLCFDHFRDVNKEFAAGMSRTTKVLRLVDHCDRHKALPELLAALHEERPAQYDKWLETLEARPNPDSEKDFDGATGMGTLREGEQSATKKYNALSEADSISTEKRSWRKVRQPVPISIPKGTSDKRVKLRVPPMVWDIGCAGLILLVIVALWPSIRGAKVPIPRPTAEAPSSTPTPPTPRVIKLPPRPTPTPTLGIGSTRVSEKDGMVMVYVPAGEFLMGSTDSDTSASSDEKPQHRVYLDAFWIDRTEVTNEMFAKFVKVSGHKTDTGTSFVLDLASGLWIDKMTGFDWQHPRGPDSNLAGLDQHPVTLVSWNDAVAYCTWVGRRLPTEAEWEKAARGTDELKFPWGDQDAAGDLLNFADSNLDIPAANKGINDGSQFTAPVGSYPKGASPYDVWDMAGNVWEWVTDWYDPAYYRPVSVENPRGPDSKQRRVLRGGAWTNEQKLVRAATRYSSQPNLRYVSVGFRCARSP